MNLRIVAVALAALVVAASSASARQSCISDNPFELEECGIHRGPNEPAAHCGGEVGRRGTGGNGWSERQVMRVKPDEKPVIAVRTTAGVEPMTWGQVKHALAAR